MQLQGGLAVGQEEFEATCPTGQLFFFFKKCLPDKKEQVYQYNSYARVCKCCKLLRTHYCETLKLRGRTLHGFTEPVVAKLAANDNAVGNLNRDGGLRGLLSERDRAG